MPDLMESLKYVIFFGAFLVGIPFSVFMANRYRWYEKFIFFLMIFFTCVEITINFVSLEHYRGSSRGFEIGLVNLAAIALFILIMQNKKKYKPSMPPGSTLYFIYFFLSLLSIVNIGGLDTGKNQPYLTYYLFEVWKMIKMYFYFWVFYNYINSFEKIRLFIIYVACISSYILYLVLKQKYILSFFQCHGPFPHQNSMVMYLIIFGSLCISALINRKDNWFFTGLYAFSSAACGICIISSLSRAGMAVFAFSCFIVWLFSFAAGFSLRKIGFTILALIAGTLVLYKAKDTIIERFETAPEASATTRIKLAIAARRMANDRTLGIGLNNFGVKINYPYKYSDHTSDWKPDQKSGLVETVYLMIAAEAGWHTMAIYIIWLFYMYGRNIVLFFKLKGHAYRFVVIGFAGGLMAIYLESTLEWVLKQTGNFYQLMMVFALIGAIGKLKKQEDKKKKLEKYAKLNKIRKISESSDVQTKEI